MSRTSHCVCSPTSSAIDSSLKPRNNDMPSPPIPPRTLRVNLSPSQNKWAQLDDKIICCKDKVKCNCNRPHSCPAKDSSPPIPPKSNAQNVINKSKHQMNKKIDEQFLNLQKQTIGDSKFSDSHRSSRKVGRHNSSDADKSRKKSRSKSRPLAQAEMVHDVRPSGDEQYFRKNDDNLMDRNCEMFFKTNNAKFCLVAENNDKSLKLCPQQIHHPDLIPNNRSNASKIAQTTMACSSEMNCPKPTSKSRMKKLFGFWTKSKKTVNSSRTSNVTPDAVQSFRAADVVVTRPRRSKSLHLISSLSPTTSVHAKAAVVISPQIKAKSSSIFAVISPTTTRLKRNFLCISPIKSNCTSNKKPIVPVSMTVNNKSILSDNCQSRPVTNTVSERESTSNTNHYGVTPYHKLRLDFKERDKFNETDPGNKISSSSFKIHNHQDSTQRKTPLSSNNPIINNRQLVANTSQTPRCSCTYYRSTDHKCSCNNAYRAPPPPHPTPPTPPTHFCPSCGCFHNQVRYDSNHYHCCDGNPRVWCLVPCCCCLCSCTDQMPTRQHSFCTCHIYNQSSSPPATSASRQLLPPPPPPPPPPVPSFSNSHQFSRRYRQSYSKTPPPSFHSHPMPCHDDYCYQQRMLLTHQMTCNNCSGPVQNKRCCLPTHSKCSACGSLFYDELKTATTHYNKTQCSNNNALITESIYDRQLTSSMNADDFCNCRCLYNQSSHRHSETCGRHSNEMRNHSCIHSGLRSSLQPYGVIDRDRSSSKHRKDSSNSCHGANIDPDNVDDKHDLLRPHYNSLTATTSVHISPENTVNCDTALSTNNNINNNVITVSNSISNVLIMSSSNTLQNDKKQQQFEPWRKIFHDNMMALRNLGWYWGPLNHLEAENLVQDRPDGTFLVRDSGNEAYFLSLTFRVLGTTYHTRIEYSQGKFSFWSQPESHSAATIVEFIDKAVAHSVSGKFHYFLQTNTPGQPPMEVSLLYPLSRYQIVQSLQHLSRFVILSNIRRDHVSQLQLPQCIKSYLMAKQYYIDCIDTFVNLTKDSESLTYEPSSVSTIRNL